MCGIAGIIHLDSRPVDPAVLTRMTDSMIHRGPDDAGVYVCGSAGLGMRRLSIIDIKTGHQPISNEDGSHWIVFNGEIYNHAELRATLESKGHRYKTHSDTESILHAYEEYGDSCVEHLRGMFAFAVWDAKRRRLFVARDRLGIKPLYFIHSNGTLSFASELKALLRAGLVDQSVNHSAMAEYFTLGYSAGDDTIFNGVQKLPPGHFLVAEKGHVAIHRYWDLPLEPAEPSEKDPGRGLLELFEESVRSHLVSEVPLGVFLSGGVDSSAIVSAISRIQGEGFNTFSIGFGEEGVVDETPYAQLVAQQFHTVHQNITLSEKEYWDALQTHVWHMEEPISDPPSISLLLMSKWARRRCTVLLSGEGADELFAGYGLYKWMARSEALRRTTGLDRLGYLGGIGRWFGRPGWSALVPLRHKYWGVQARVRKPVSRGIFSQDFWRATVPWSIPPAIEAAYDRVRNRSALDQMLYLDTKIWLPNNLLARADKMTMAASVELRVPFLDHKLVEFAFRLPGSLKIRKGVAKFIEKRELARDLPPQIVNRRKEGFTIPFRKWMGGAWLTHMDELISEASGPHMHYFDRSVLARVMKEHRTGRQDHGNVLWSLLVFMSWHRQFMQPTGKVQWHEASRSSPLTREVLQGPAACSLDHAEQ